MSASSPIGAARALWLIACLGARRWSNRMSAGFGRRSKPRPDRTRSATGTRAATPRKRAVGFVGLAFLGTILAFAATMQASQLVRRLVAAEGDVMLVDRQLYRRLRWGHGGSDERRDGGFVIPVGEREELLDRIETALEVPLVGGPIDPALARERAEEIVAHFERRGLRGFAEDAPIHTGIAGRIHWPDGEAESRVVGGIGLILLVLSIAALCGSLASHNQDFGRAEWSFEWLYSMPASARVLLWAKLGEHTLLSPFLWMTSAPLCFVALLLSGRRWDIALLMSALATVYLSAVVAGPRLVLETWLRMRFGMLRNLQAVCTVLTTVLLILVLWAASGPGLPDWMRVAGQHLPVALVPPSLPALLVHRDAPSAPAWLAMAGGAAALCVLSVALATRMVRGGLTAAVGGPLRGTRGVAPRSSKPGEVVLGPGRLERLPFLRGALGKDLRLLARDRAFLVQTLVVPLLVLAVQLVMNRGLLGAIASDPRHGATFAFGMGAYMLVFSAAAVLAVEGSALWMLFSAPRPLDRVLREKTWMWAVIAALYTAAILAGTSWLHGPPGPRGAVDLVIALVGVPIYAFVAAGLGALATDPLEQDIRRRVSPATMYLYLLLASMYAHAIYTPELWTKLVQVVLSALLAYALWQKLRDRIPFLLDPTDAPPARLALSDGLIALLVFFTAQGIVFLLLEEAELAVGMRLLLSFAMAGPIAVACSLYALKRARVQDVARTVGLASTGRSGGKVALDAVGGLGAGVITGGLALGYVWLIDRVPFLSAEAEALDTRLSLRDAGWQWFFLAAVVLAPLFEEFLFRGLVLRGLQRTLGSWQAVVASAALFAIVHPAISLPAVLLLGLVTAVAAVRSGSLLAPILCHAAYNATVLGLPRLFWWDAGSPS